MPKGTIQYVQKKPSGLIPCIILTCSFSVGLIWLYDPTVSLLVLVLGTNFLLEKLYASGYYARAIKPLYIPLRNTELNKKPTDPGMPFLMAFLFGLPALGVSLFSALVWQLEAAGIAPILAIFIYGVRILELITGMQYVVYSTASKNVPPFLSMVRIYRNRLKNVAWMMYASNVLIIVAVGFHIYYKHLV